MSVNAFGVNFPPLADGAPYDLLIALWQRTGGATGIVPKVATGLAATGTTAADALALTVDWNQVETVPAGSGVAMPPLVAGQDITVFNQGANPLLVYPPTGMRIDALAVNAGYSLPVGKMQCFLVLTASQVRSTQFG